MHRLPRPREDTGTEKSRSVEKMQNFRCLDALFPASPAYRSKFSGSLQIPNTQSDDTHALFYNFTQPHFLLLTTRFQVHPDSCHLVGAPAQQHQFQAVENDVQTCCFRAVARILDQCPTGGQC